MKLLIPVFILLFSYCSAVSAYEIVKGKDNDRYADTFQSDLNKDGTIETVKLIKKDIADTTINKIMANGIIQVESKGKVFTNEVDDLSRYYSEIQELVISDKVKPFIVVSSFATGSAHAWNATLYSFNGKKIMQELDLWSDGPSIEVKDVGNDGIKDIVVTTRDYENEGWKDSFIQTYKYLNNKWQLVSVYRTKTKEQISISDWIKEHSATEPKK